MQPSGFRPNFDLGRRERVSHLLPRGRVTTRLTFLKYQKVPCNGHK